MNSDVVAMNFKSKTKLISPPVRDRRTASDAETERSNETW